MTRWTHLAVAILGSVLVGCAPAIGDSCETSADCSVNGDRICDNAYPGGYCTVVGCDTDTCPDDAVCVEWRFSPDRTASTYCMASCGGDGDCRGADYACLGDADERLRDEVGQPIARSLDSNVSESTRYCVGINAEPLE